MTAFPLQSPNPPNQVHMIQMGDNFRILLCALGVGSPDGLIRFSLRPSLEQEHPRGQKTPAPWNKGQAKQMQKTWPFAVVMPRGIL